MKEASPISRCLSCAGISALVYPCHIPDSPDHLVSRDFIRFRSKDPDLPVLPVSTQDVPHQEQIDVGEAVEDDDDDRLHGRPTVPGATSSRS